MADDTQQADGLDGEHVDVERLTARVSRPYAAADGADNGSLTPGVTAPRREPTVILDPRNVLKITLVVLAALAAALFARFVMEDAGGVIFTILMSLALAVTMEPAVGWMARRGMRRGLATGIVMLSVIVGTVFFFLIFGQLLASQLVELFKSVPALADSLVSWVNSTFGTTIDLQNIIGSLGLDTGEVAKWAASVAGGLLSLLLGIVGSVFSVFTLALFTFYLSADMPRLKRWIARFLPRSGQRLNEELWTVAVEKAGGYVAARLILALINGGTTALVLYLIGMPYWLALGIWTGIVAQFVPTIGTYIAIALPVIIGLLSDDPKDGVIALAWALLYQQVENLTLEPRISAKAVDLHPAVSFGAVMFGAALFGAAGALLAVPVAAIIMSFFEAYAPEYEVDEAASGTPPPGAAGARASRVAHDT